MGENERVYPIHGGYYPPGTAPELHLAAYKYAAKKGLNLKSPEYYLPDTKEITKDNYIPARRVSHKTKDGVETLDTGYDKETMGKLLDAYKVAHEKFGVPMMNPKQLTAMALEEGRSNFGFNDFDENNKHAVNLHKALINQGFDPYAAGFPAAILDKQQTATRLNKPYFEVWNGKGVAARNYNQRVNKALDVVDHPKNQELKQFIQDKLGYVPPAKPAPQAKPISQVSPDLDIEPDIQLAQASPMDTVVQNKRGGMIDKPLQGNRKTI